MKSLKRTFASVSAASLLAVGLFASASGATAAPIENLPIQPVGYKIANGAPDRANPMSGAGLTADKGLASTRAFGGTEPVSRSLIGPDGREQVADTRAPKYRRIGQINFTRNGSTYICTGWLISSRSVATAGHCLEGNVSNITFAPARNGSTDPYGKFNATEIWVDARGLGNGGDWGVIVLDQPIGDRLGWYGLAPASQAELQSGSATVVGYPGDKPRGTMWQDTDALTGADARNFYYKTDTYGGQSGSAVTTTNEDVSTGIHIWGGSSNGATRLTGELFNTLAALRK
ncbi:trypsin-like serine peptidase [Haematomicrobium sanguinis]|uniref:trypsin-like serine peptidase n=1 Tax=Haematomicrobium sanguinis TaxID=479106 RepID=UPI0005532156|nr:trypsin-like serine protease [Haematomicrobium sanguinis]